MKITNEPLTPDTPVRFIITGFPEENAVRSSIERFYNLKADVNRNFLAFNGFGEQIFAGKVDEGNKIAELNTTSRASKASSFEPKPQ
jgi:hypothetical protein